MMVVSILNKFKKGLKKTHDNLTTVFSVLLNGLHSLGTEKTEELEEVLLQADVGLETAEKIIEEVKKADIDHKNHNEMNAALKKTLKEFFYLDDKRALTLKEKPSVVLFVGVNGSGKTTSIAKFSKMLSEKGKKVMLAGCDTFRAAAIEQISVWAGRLDIPVVKGFSGADPASVAYDAHESALSKNIDCLIIDTAGRQHTKDHLMEELKKIINTIRKKDTSQPSEVFLVLDSTTGQNGLSQAQKFNEFIGLTGVVLTKMDGTAKGGIALRIEKTLGIPVKYIGLGEEFDDFCEFDPDSFCEALIN